MECKKGILRTMLCLASKAYTPNTPIFFQELLSFAAISG